MAKVPIYQKIREDLLGKIETGVYEEGTMIPKEVELAQQYGVSRPTIRQAIHSLVAQGYLERTRRKGTMVRNQKIVQSFAYTLESFNQDIYSKGMVPSTKVLSWRVVEAEKEVAANLAVRLGEAVYKLVRLRYADGKPVVYVVTYLPYRGYEQLEQVDFAEESLYEHMEGLGGPVERLVRILEIAQAGEMGDLLEIPQNSSVFAFQSIGFTGEGRPVEYSLSKYRTDLNKFVFEVYRANGENK